jgi:hypothetical protein
MNIILHIVCIINIDGAAGDFARTAMMMNRSVVHVLIHLMQDGVNNSLFEESLNIDTLAL